MLSVHVPQTALHARQPDLRPLKTPGTLIKKKLPRFKAAPFIISHATYAACNTTYITKLLITYFELTWLK